MIACTCFLVGIQFQYIQGGSEGIINDNAAMVFSLAIYGLRSVVTGALMYSLSVLNPTIYSIRLTSSVTFVVSLTMLIRFFTTGSQGMYLVSCTTRLDIYYNTIPCCIYHFSMTHIHI